MKALLFIFLNVFGAPEDSFKIAPFNTDSMLLNDSVEVLIPTFRGNTERNWGGYGKLSSLNTIWRFDLGEGITVIGRKTGSRKWKGAGWTGQPLLVKEGKDTFLIQGAYDHHLRKINAATGEEIWSYKFDDVIKGTGTIWVNRQAYSKENSIIIMQGSRLGTNHYLDTDFVPSLRAVSYFSGKELWRMNVELTSSYSRDVDASVLMYNDTAYIGLENSVFVVFDPNPSKAEMLDSMLQPEIFEKHLLYNEADVVSHGGNVVTESSPALLGNRVFVSSGTGHVYGYNLSSRKVDWDFFVGSDMDGSAVVTSDSCLLITVEKQYISGKGGTFKLDPSKSPDSSVVWYFPVADSAYASWEGGIIGTAGINDAYINGNQTKLAAFTGIDGYTYIVRHDSIDRTKQVYGPNKKKKYYKPILIRKIKTGPSISSPLITEDEVLVCGYHGIYLYQYDNDLNFSKLDHRPFTVEASPILWGKRVYVATREGFLYCLGEK
jgi:outer membrane protein assembly factor BamB